MKIINKEDWNKGKANNTDEYGAAGYRFAENWANLMEKEISKGKKLADVAERTSHEADTMGITGFLFGCAVHILSHCWEHGEELRKWHNKEFGYEGDGVVNPAIITVETKESEEA